METLYEMQLFFVLIIKPFYVLNISPQAWFKKKIVSKQSHCRCPLSVLCVGAEPFIRGGTVFSLLADSDWWCVLVMMKGGQSNKGHAFFSCYLCLFISIHRSSHTHAHTHTHLFTCHSYGLDSSSRLNKTGNWSCVCFFSRWSHLLTVNTVCAPKIMMWILRPD